MGRSILFVAGEGLPFVKTGGLADVIGALPKALVQKGHDARVVLPLYSKIIEKHYDKLERLGTIQIHSGWIDQPATYYKAEADGVIYYFVEHQGYFEREGLYGYEDDGERFAFFQRAVLDMIYFINWWPNIIHSNDWQTGMIPLMAHACYADDYRYQSIKHVYTIHNMAFQGNFGVDMLPTCLGLDYSYFDDGSIKFDTGISFMKAGIVYADKITTVSNTYAKEIQTPYYGEGLDGLLSARWQSLWGIVNGIDYDVWNPETDPQVYKNYNIHNFRELKKINKLELQKECGLPQDENQFVIGIISRLTDQKGLDLVDRIMNDICCDGVQFIVLGTGDRRYEDMFRYYQGIHPAKVSANIYYSDERSHKMYAGCDVMLVPSRFEPCGLTQLMALRYGTVPVVRETGGLADTVFPYNEYENKGTGFSFANYDAYELLGAINYAKEVYYNHKDNWYGIIERGMSMDYSWYSSAKIYNDLYNSL